MCTRSITFTCNIKYKLKQQISAGTTKCCNIVRMATKAAAFQLRRSASRMQPVGCATFRNSCGHFEQMLIENTRCLQTLIMRREWWSRGSRAGVKGWDGESGFAQEKRRVGASIHVLNYTEGKSCRLFDGSVAFTMKKVSRISKISDCLQDIGTKRQTRRNLETS